MVAIPFSALAVLPTGLVRFVIAKALVFALAGMLGCFASSAGRLPRAVVLILGLGTGVLMVAATQADSPWGAWFGRWPRYEGVFILALYVAGVWLGARLLGPAGDGRPMEWFLRALAAASIVLGVASVLEELGVHILGEFDAERTGSLMGNATEQGLLGMVALAVLWRPALDLRDRWSMVGAAAGLLTVVLSGSRAAFLAVGVVLVVHALVARRRVAGPAFGVAAAAVTLALAIPQMRDRLLSGHTVRGRSLLWQETGDLMADHPWLGVGPSQYADRISEYHGARWVTDVGVANPVDSPHNWILQAWSAGGFPLAVLAVALAGVVLWHGVRAVRTESSSVWAAGALAAVMGAGTVLLTHPTSVGTVPIVAVLAGSLVAMPPQTKTLATRAAPVVAATATVTVAVAMFAAAVGEHHLNAGLEAAAAGKIDEADAAFDKARTWRPWDADVAIFAAASLAEPASFGVPEAVAATSTWARLALERTPRSTQAAVAMAVATGASRQFDTALVVLDATVRRDPTAPSVRIQRALARYATGDVSGALADLEYAAELDPDNPAPARLVRIIDQREKR